MEENTYIYQHPPAQSDVQDYSTKSSDKPTSVKSQEVKYNFRTKIKNYFCSWTRNGILKVTMVSSLVGASILISLLIYLSLVRLEQSIFNSEYNSLTYDALDSTERALDRASLAALSMATVYSETFPNATSWPNVYLPGFERLARLSMGITSAFTFAFLPIVTPEKVIAFENFMKEKISTDPTVPPGVGRNSAGEFGVFFGNILIDPPQTRSDRSGLTFLYDSPYRILTPIAQVGQDQSKRTIMFNAHQFEPYGRAVDDIITCFDINRSPCGRFSDFIRLADELENIQQTLVVHTITPAYNPSDLVGVIAAIIDWKATLIDVLPSDVSGILYVVKSPTRSFSYVVEDGMPRLLGGGDLHDRRYTRFARERAISLKSEIDPNAAVTYTVTFYPTNKYYSKYLTNFPLYSSFGAAFIILLTSIIFFVYDKFMTKDNMNIQMVLDAKRQFVRFVSHEVRTPLNTVSMGIRLVHSELRDFLQRNTPPMVGGGYENQALPLKPDEVLSRLFTDNIPGWLQLTEEISENVENAVTVLNDLLNYDKIEVGSLKLEIQVLNIWDLINKTVRAFDLQARNAGVEIILKFNHIDNPQISLKQKTRRIHTGGSIKLSTSTKQSIPFDMDAVKVVGDPTRLAQVVRNLVSNALKFTPANGTIKIEGEWITNPTLSNSPFTYETEGKTVTCPYQRAGAIRLSVTDSGAGLSPEQLQRIFGEGVQFNANTLQAGQGSGLGLFITKGIVEKHQGTIKVHSDGLGTGTTFTVELPLFFVTSQPGSNFGARKIGPECDNVNLFPPLHDCPQTLSAEVFAQILAEHPIKNVLVVDDTVSNRKMLIRLLKNRGCTCVEAGNGQEALDVYNDALKGEELSFGLEPFDAILMDYEMPVKNGPQATKELREKGCAGFIVGITGNVLPSDIQFFKDHGVDAVLPKPLEIDLLLHEWAQFKANSLRIDIFPTPITTKLNCSSDTQSGKTEFQLEDVYAADSSFL